jgi:D-glycero-alpha-D-manno-heptose 1-phosphate guanylyltransferase
MENLWIKFNKPILVSTTVKKAERYGLLTSHNGFVSGFHEKGEKKDALINAGCYLFPSDYLNIWNFGDKFSLEKDHIQKKFKNEKIMCLKSKGLFIDIGIPEDYQNAQILLKDEI